MLKDNMNNMATIILKALPPDTPDAEKLLMNFKTILECMNQLRFGY